MKTYLIINRLIVLWLCGLAVAVTTMPVLAQERLKQSSLWQASWHLESEQFQERTQHTVYLRLSSEAPITQVLNVGAISQKDLFFEQASEFWVYGRETVNNRTFETAMMKYHLYPAKSGQFSLPEVIMTVGNGSEMIRTVAPQKRIEVQALNPQARGKLVSSKVSMSQALSSREITEGGAVTRTLRVDVDALPGHYIAQLPPMSAVEGAEVRVGNSDTTTAAYRGSLTGTRTTEIHYRFSESGDYELPEFKLEWWNETRHQVETILIPSEIVHVVPAPPLPWAQRWDNAIEASIDWLVRKQRQLLLMMLSTVALYFTRHCWLAPCVFLQRRLARMARSQTTQLVTILLKSIFCGKATCEKLAYRWVRILSKSNIGYDNRLQRIIFRDKQNQLTVRKLPLLKYYLDTLCANHNQRYGLKEIN